MLKHTHSFLYFFGHCVNRILNKPKHKQTCKQGPFGARIEKINGKIQKMIVNEKKIKGKPKKRIANDTKKRNNSKQTTMFEAKEWCNCC